MKNTNPKNKKITLSKEYVKGFMLDNNGIDSVIKVISASNEVYMLETSDYDDGTGSVTLSIHFKD